MASSILSSLRKLLKNTKLRKPSFEIYKVSYLVAKVWGIIKHYNLYFLNFNRINNNLNLKKGFISYLLIHLTQTYFIVKIIKSYYLKN